MPKFQKGDRVYLSGMHYRNINHGDCGTVLRPNFDNDEDKNLILCEVQFDNANHPTVLFQTRLELCPIPLQPKSHEE